MDYLKVVINVMFIEDDSCTVSAMVLLENIPTELTLKWFRKNSNVCACTCIETARVIK